MWASSKGRSGGRHPSKRVDARAGTERLGLNIMVKQIDIKTPAQVQKLSELASQEPYDISLVTSTVVLDARSLLGLYSLIGQRVTVAADDHADPVRFAKLLKKLG